MDRHSDTRSQMNLGKRDSGVETAWLIAEIPDFSKGIHYRWKRVFALPGSVSLTDFRLCRHPLYVGISIEDWSTDVDPNLALV